MKDLFCLSERAIQVIREPAVKWKILYAIESTDTRTIEKHIKTNFPNSPLMSYNVLAVIREVYPHLKDEDIYRKLTEEDVRRIEEKRKENRVTNSKYNNPKKQNK